MCTDTGYKITMLEYAFQSVMSSGIAYCGYSDHEPEPSVTYTLTLLENGGEKILIDTGYDDGIEENRKLAGRACAARGISYSEDIDFP